jgi:hypothetical protein
MGAVAVAAEISVVEIVRQDDDQGRRPDGVPIGHGVAPAGVAAWVPIAVLAALLRPGWTS